MTSFYGFGERELGAAVEVHLGSPTDVADVPRLLRCPVESLADPPGARIDEAGLVELRPGEELEVPLADTSDVDAALVRICFPRRDSDGTVAPEEGWVLTIPALPGASDGR